MSEDPPTRITVSTWTPPGNEVEGDFAGWEQSCESGTDEGVLIGSYILLDPHTNWHISNDTGVPSDRYDLETTAAHEFGHSAGFNGPFERGHLEPTRWCEWGTDTPFHTMCAAIIPGSAYGRSLESEDRWQYEHAYTRGYWLAARDGGVFNYGGARFYGSMGGQPLNQPIVGIASRPQGDGYWLVAADGGIFSFGGAQFHGSMGGQPLNKPVVGMASTPSGRGYWLVASDGGIFSFGDAAFYGSLGGARINLPIVNMEPLPNGRGYWLVAGDGGIFAFGDAPFRGSLGGGSVRDIVDMSSSPSGGGYHLLGANGAVYRFGDALEEGGVAGERPGTSFVGIDGTTYGRGYNLVGNENNGGWRGRVRRRGDAGYWGQPNGPLNSPLVGVALKETQGR